MSSPNESSVREERRYRVTVTFAAKETPVDALGAMLSALEERGYKDAAATGEWVPTCRAVLMLGGAPQRCDLRSPHPGLAHSNSESQSTWTDDPELITFAWASAEEAGR